MNTRSPFGPEGPGGLEDFLRMLQAAMNASENGSSNNTPPHVLRAIKALPKGIPNTIEIPLRPAADDDDVKRYLREQGLESMREKGIPLNSVDSLTAVVINHEDGDTEIHVGISAGAFPAGDNSESVGDAIRRSLLERAVGANRSPLAGLVLEDDDLDQIPEPLRSLLNAGRGRRSPFGFEPRSEARGRQTARPSYNYRVPVEDLDQLIARGFEHDCGDPDCPLSNDLRQRRQELEEKNRSSQPQHVGLTPLQARQAVDAALSDIYHAEIEPLMEPIKDVAAAYKKVKNGARWIKQNVFAPIWNGLTASAEALYVLFLSAIMSVILLALIALSAVLSFGFLPMGIAYAFGGITDWNILALFSWMGWFPLALTSWIIGIVDTRVEHKHDKSDGKDKVRITTPASWHNNAFVYEQWMIAGIHLRMWTYAYIVDPILDVLRVIFSPEHREAAELPIIGDLYYSRAARWLVPHLKDGDHFFAHTLPYWWSAITVPEIRNYINHERLTFEGRRVWKFARLGRWIHRNITMRLALKSKTVENEEFWNAITAPLNYIIGFLRMSRYMRQEFYFSEACRNAVFTGMMHRINVGEALAAVKEELVFIAGDVRGFLHDTFVERPVAQNPTDSLVEELSAVTTLEDVEREYRYQGGNEVAWLMPKKVMDGIADLYDSKLLLEKLGFTVVGEHLHYYVVLAPNGWTRELGYPFSEFTGNGMELGAWVENDPKADYLDTDEILYASDGHVEIDNEFQLEQPDEDEIAAWLRGLEEKELEVPAELEPGLDLPDWLTEVDEPLAVETATEETTWLLAKTKSRTDQEDTRSELEKLGFRISDESEYFYEAVPPMDWTKEYGYDAHTIKDPTGQVAFKVVYNITLGENPVYIEFPATA